MKNEKYHKNVVDIVALIASDKKLLEEFFIDILTPQEFDDISVRFEIIKRLARGETHRSIADVLGVGIATVARGSRELLDPQGGFAQVLNKLAKK